jgi:hypothetical protein
MPLRPEDWRQLTRFIAVQAIFIGVLLLVGLSQHAVDQAMFVAGGMVLSLMILWIVRTLQKRP